MYRFTKEQFDVYTWLKNQNLNVDANTLSYWSRTYSPQRLRDVVNFANERRASGQAIQNMGGWVHRLLKTGFAVVNDTCKANREFAMRFKEGNNWNELRIYEKYVLEISLNDDLPLTLQKEDFHRALKALYSKSKLYKNS